MTDMPDPAGGITPSAPGVPGHQPARGTFLGMPPQDTAVLACGALAVIGSLGSYYTVRADGVGTVTTSFNAWQGLLGGLGVVLAVAGSAVLAAGPVGVGRVWPLRSVVLVLYLAAAAATLASFAVTPGGLCDDLVYLESGCDGAVTGRGGGFWRTLLATGGGAFVTSYWHVVDRLRCGVPDDSSRPAGRW